MFGVRETAFERLPETTQLEILLVHSFINQTWSAKTSKLPTRLIPLALRLLRPLRNDVEEAIFLVSERWAEVSRVPVTVGDPSFYHCLIPAARIAFERDTIAYRPILARVLARCNESSTDRKFTEECVRHWRTVCERRSPFAKELTDALVTHGDNLVYYTDKGNEEALALYREAANLVRVRYDYYAKFGDAKARSDAAIDLAIALSSQAKILILCNKVIDARMQMAEAMLYFIRWEPTLSTDPQKLCFRVYDTIRWISHRLEQLECHSEALSYLLDGVATQKRCLSIKEGYQMADVVKALEEVRMKGVDKEEEGKEALEWLKSLGLSTKW